MVKASLQKWVVVICVALGAWLIVFAVLNRRQTPSEDSPYKHPALSKATRAILDGSEKFVLVSLDPTPPGMESNMDLLTNVLSSEKNKPPTANVEPKQDTRERFHNYPVLGRTEIKDLMRKRELLKALYGGVKKIRGGISDCFEPRHGIIANRGTNSVELVICFECEQIAEYADGNNAWSLMSKEPRELFNRTLVEAGVPLAKR
jgi:hypothetical protein